MTWIESEIYTFALIFAGGMVWGYILGWYYRRHQRRRQARKKQILRRILADLELKDS